MTDERRNDTAHDRGGAGGDKGSGECSDKRSAKRSGGAQAERRGVESEDARGKEGDRDERGTCDNEVPAAARKDRRAADEWMEKVAPKNEQDRKKPDPHRGPSRAPPIDASEWSKETTVCCSRQAGPFRPRRAS